MQNRKHSTGAIVIIDDDFDDREIFEEILHELGYKNSILHFDDGRAALDFFRETKEDIFIILSDVNMPKIDGIRLREIITADESCGINVSPLFTLQHMRNKVLSIKPMLFLYRGVLKNQI